MKRWTNISTTNEDPRWNLLSERLKQVGVVNEFVPWTGEVEKFNDISVLEGFDHMRVSSRLGPRVLEKLKVQSSWVTLLGVIDGMVHTDHGWWPLCALFESFSQILIERGRDLDPRGNVLIAGAGGAARTAIVAFFKAGFNKFLITNFKEDEAQNLIAQVRRNYFGLKIDWVPVDRIVLLPGETSVLVNCTPSVEENQLLVELSYLNFLKRPGILFDLMRSKKPSALVEEAVEAGVELITGSNIGARTDVLWAKWAFGAELDRAAYIKEFESALS